MRKIFLFLLSFCITVTGFSQIATDKVTAFELVTKNSKNLGFTDQELKEFKVAQSFSDAATGATYVYLQQTVKDIPVLNKIIVLAFKNGKILSKAGTLFSQAEEFTKDLSASPVVSAESAIQSAVQYLKAGNPSFSSTANVTPDGKLHFGTLGIAYEEVTAQLLWLPVEKVGSKSSLKLIWQVLLAPLHTTDMWYIRVDAQNSSFINKINLTVYEEFKEHSKDQGVQNPLSVNNISNTVSSLNTNSPTLVGTANYLVIPYPVESPLYGPATTVTNPWTLAGASNPNATTLKWHNDGVTDYTITRGNNVWATEDRAAANQNTGLPATSSTTPDPLNFIFTPDYTVAPTDPNFQQFAITNLFYWNNIMHDLSYNYGFNEATGNFQTDNMGRGGTGNDNVKALAQSGAGTNNANFSTPPDGGRGQMRMYLFTAPNPDRDGDIDNGIISHEYTHGISNRLTGGIAGGGGCLSNAEEGGEGWSDYFGLMVTTNWATALITDGFTKRRPIGNYVLNQPITGAGIRTKPYCTDFTVNNLTYAFVAASGGEVHNIGEVWCATLWDMTWNIIQTAGINTNLFNATGAGGNSIALKLVTEGMKLQPCSPGFLDARDAILRADQILYGGTYHCAIMSAFARRGMGTDARQGSSGSTSDQIIGFSTVESALTLTQNVTQQQEGLSIIYTNRVTAGPCGALTNYLVTDTLPANVTYVSGGSYNAANRVVSFPVNLAAGASQNYLFTVSINAGSYFPPVTLFQDVVPGPGIPAAIWSISSTTGTNWAVSSARSHTPPSSYYSLNTPIISDQRLFSAAPIALGATPPKLTFWHWYNTESTYDGGILEISTDGGTVYNYVPQANMISGGYTTPMDASTVLAGKTAWSGNSGGFIRTTVNLTPYANQNIKLRFRSTTDNGTALEGWYVDDIEIKDSAVVDMRSSLFNGSGVRVQISDTFTIILPPVSTPAITTQPLSTTVCAGSNATFTVTATGTAPLTYQWQVSTTGAGGPWTNLTNVAPYSNVTTASLTITGATLAMNNYQYRVVVTNANGAVTSAPAVLTVNAPSFPVITTQPASISACAGTTANFNVTATGAGLTYQWQVSTNGGVLFTNIAGATSATLSLPGVTASMNNNQYRVIITGGCPATNTTTSNAATLTVNTSTLAITANPSGVTVCAGSNATYTVTATGTGLTYQWQVSTDGGATYTNIAGATSNPLVLTGVTAAMSGNLYRVVVKGTGTCDPAAGLTSTGALLTVQALPAITSQPTGVTGCPGSSATFSVTATGTNLTYQWQSSGTGCGGAFTNIAGATGASYNIPSTTTGMSGTGYRVIVSGTCTPAVTSNCVLLTVNSGITINSQPVSVTACAGSNATFSVTATGGTPVYQWQVSTDGGSTFTDIPGATANTLTLTGVTAAMNNNQYHVLISNACTPVITSANVTLTVQTAAAITAQPTAATTTCTGTTATLSVTATGTNITYQWQSAATCAGPFTNIAGATGAMYNAPTAVAGTTAYRVVVSGVCTPASVTSNCVTVTVVTTTVITAQPINATACAGNNASFAVTASGATTYQWQVSTNGGTTFTDITGATSATLNLTGVTGAMSGNQYRVIINGCPAPLTSNAATLTVQSAAAITIQPIGITSCATTATFAVTATGIGITYQWQVSTDGGLTYTNIAGATTNTLVLNNLTPASSGNKYRVVVSSGTCGAPVTSTAVSATVGIPPSVVLTAAPFTAYNPTVTGGLYVTVSPTGNYSYQWTRDGAILPNVTASSITAANGLLFAFGTYQVRVTDVATGCSTLSNTIRIDDIPGGRNVLFISPNPTPGLIHISYYSTTTAAQARQVGLYDSKGAKLMTKAFSVTGTYGTMDMDLSNLSRGTYMVILRDASGNKIASERVVKL